MECTSSSGQAGILHACILTKMQDNIHIYICAEVKAKKEIKKEKKITPKNNRKTILFHTYESNWGLFFIISALKLSHLRVLQLSH